MHFLSQVPFIISILCLKQSTLFTSFPVQIMEWFFNKVWKNVICGWSNLLNLLLVMVNGSDQKFKSHMVMVWYRPKHVFIIVKFVSNKLIILCCFIERRLSYESVWLQKTLACKNTFLMGIIHQKEIKVKIKSNTSKG